MGIRIVTSSGGGSCSCNPSGPNLDSYSASLKDAWAFNVSSGNFLSSKDNEGHLVVGGTAWNYGVEGKRSFAATTGASSYAYHGDAGFAPEGTAAEFTVQFWIKWTGGSGRLFSWYDDITSQSNSVSIHAGSSGQITVQNNGSTSNASSNNVLVANQWNQVILQRDSDSTRLVVNGVLEVTDTNSGWDQDLTDYNLLLNRAATFYGATGQGFDGGLYYTAALSAAAYGELWLKGRGTFIADATGLSAPSGAYLDAAASDCLQSWSFSQAASPLTNDFTGGEEFRIDTGSGEDYEQTCIVNKSVKFGNTQSWKCTGAPMIDIGTGDFSFSCWVYSDTASASFYPFTWTTNIGSFSSSFWLQRNGSKWQLVGITGSTIVIDSAAVYPDDTWQLLTLVRQSGTTKLYVNKDEIGSSSTLNGVDLRSYELYAGRIISHDSEDSRVGTSVLYGTALDINQITELYDDLAVAT